MSDKQNAIWRDHVRAMIADGRLTPTAGDDMDSDDTELRVDAELKADVVTHMERLTAAALTTAHRIPHVRNLAYSFKIVGICMIWSRCTGWAWARIDREIHDAWQSDDPGRISHEIARLHDEAATLQESLTVMIKPYIMRIPPFGFGGVYLCPQQETTR